MKRNYLKCKFAYYFFVISIAVLSIAQVTSAAMVYNITYLETLPGDNRILATDINDLGQVVGYMLYSDAETLGFLRENGVMTELGTLPGDIYSQATGINDLRQVVGYSIDKFWKPQAFLWENGVMVELETLPGDIYSQATGINDLGQIVGYSFDSTGFPRRVLWENCVITTELGTLPSDIYSQATGINDLGQVVGNSIDSSHYSHLVLWTPIKYITLETPTKNEVHPKKPLTINGTINSMITQINIVATNSSGHEELNTTAVAINNGNFTSIWDVSADADAGKYKIKAIGKDNAGTELGSDEVDMLYKLFFGKFYKKSTATAKKGGHSAVPLFN